MAKPQWKEGRWNAMTPGFSKLFVVIDEETGVIWNCFSGPWKATNLHYRLTRGGKKVSIRLVMARDLEKLVAERSYDYNEYEEAERDQRAQDDQGRGN